MTASTLTLRPGVTIRPGVTVKGFTAAASSFTISDTDFTASAYHGPGITDFGGSIGLLSSGTASADVAQYAIARTNITTLKLGEILAYFAANSLVTDLSLGYNFTVAGGGASNITKIILGLDSNNFIIAPADPANPNFAVDTSAMSSIVNANGILAFPVTFTLDSPLITHPGSWL
jgi:hypothetical protein